MGITRINYSVMGIIVALCWLFLGGQSAWGEVIPYSQASELKNRFRIDHMVDDVVLLIQRRYGSSPVVLVLPDGSKWYASRHPEDVKWMDGITGDMIHIKHPMAGPWQLLGNVVEGSTIKMVSKLGIGVDPIPQPLFQGERLKVTTRLLGDGLIIWLNGQQNLLVNTCLGMRTLR
jgi:uncharacterized protein (TIGR03503 family)